MQPQGEAQPRKLVVNPQTCTARVPPWGWGWGFGCARWRSAEPGSGLLWLRGCTWKQCAERLVWSFPVGLLPGCPQGPRWDTPGGQTAAAQVHESWLQSCRPRLRPHSHRDA